MGYSANYFEVQVAEWLSRRWLFPNAKLLDFGAQRFTSGDDVGSAYAELGIDYVAIDVEETSKATFFDLNTFAPPSEWCSAFDMINNEGTFEHLTHIVNAFQIAHEVLRPGGVARHSMPISGCPQHGMVYATPKFYGKLITENDYDLLTAELHKTPAQPLAPDPVFGDLSLFGDDVTMILVYRKRHASTFRIPSDLPDHLTPSLRAKIETDIINNWSAFSARRFNGDAPERAQTPLVRLTQQWRHRIRRAMRRLPSL